MTDERLPITTLGCGEARLDRVPSGQTMASPVNMPRRPSSHVTSLPCRVHFCAAAGRAQPSAITETRTANAIFGLIFMRSPYRLCLTLKSVVGIVSYSVHRRPRQRQQSLPRIEKYHFTFNGLNK